MDTIEIKLNLLARYQLSINQYLTLLKIDSLINDKDIPFTIHEEDLKILINSGYLKQVGEELYLTGAAKKLFIPNTNINFDELFDIYPAKTPNGRILRAASKEVLGKLTKDYENNAKRYSKQVKNLDIHNQIILATKAMLTDHKNRNALDYLPKLETYINQSGWERYIGQQIKESRTNTEKL